LITANSAPLVLRWIFGKRLAWPLDFGLILKDRQRLLGPHKTWRGMLGAVVSTAVLTHLWGFTYLAGAGFGALAMCGDALSSYIKRRLRTGAGHWLPGIDQAFEAVLPLLAFGAALGVSVTAAFAALLAFTIIDLVGSRLIGIGLVGQPVISRN
jgi:hypothetical protein